MSFWYVAERVGLGMLCLTWLFFGLAVATRLSRRGKIAIAIILIAFFACTAAGLLVGPVSDPTRHRWFAIVASSGGSVAMYLGIALVPVVLLCLILGGFRRLPRHSDLPPVVRFVRWLSVIAVVISLAVTTYGHVEAAYLRTSEATIIDPQVPKDFDGFRIALITDIHIGPTRGADFLGQVITHANAAEPDLIVIAGDLVDGTVAQLGVEMSRLTELQAPFGVVVTTGNHEFYSGADEWIEYLSTLGLTVLDNDGITILRGSSSIDILGINDRRGKGPHEPDLRLAADRLNASLGDTSSPDRFRILIAHEPIQAKDNDSLTSMLGIDLQLSGHTHGGQVWPLSYATKWMHGASSGVEEIAGVTVVTSRGVGTSGMPVRVGAPPEIPIITLKVA